MEGEGQIKLPDYIDMHKDFPHDPKFIATVDTFDVSSTHRKFQIH